MIYKLNITFTWIFFNIFNLIIAVIRSCLKKTAQEIAVTKRDLLKEQEVFYVSTIYNSPRLNWDVSTTTIHVRKVKLQSLLLLNAGLASFLTLPLVGNSHSVQFILKSTKDNKLREFGYKILHRILVTNKELKKFKIRNDDFCDHAA